MPVYHANIIPPGPWRIEEFAHGRWVYCYRTRDLKDAMRSYLSKSRRGRTVRITNKTG